MIDSFFKEVYNKGMRFLYRIIPVKTILIKELFPKEPISSFHIIVAIRNIFVEYENCKKDEMLALYKRCIRSDQKNYETDVDNYRKLIASIKKSGLDKKYPILMDKDKHIIDGTHRLAAMIDLNYKTAYVRIIPRAMHPVSAVERLTIMHISREDAQKVFESYHRLYDRLNV